MIYLEIEIICSCYCFFYPNFTGIKPIPTAVGTMSPSAPRGRPPNIQVTPKREPPQTTLEIKKELASSGRSSDVICVESDDETDTVSRPRKSHRSVAKMEGIVESAMYQARVIHQQAAELVSGAEVYFCIDVFGNSIKVTELRRNGWTVLSVLFFKIPIFVWPFIDASCVWCVISFH